ncbi:MAG: hypothetical protein H0V51_00580 [Chloroflexi bacterium]|nr:hypothetical protein [Chloroflexota bacterium]
MTSDSADLLIQSGDLVGRETQLREALRRLPGVTSVGELARDAASIEARIRVEFDAGATNPLIMKDALSREGFTILSASEEG